MSALDDLSKLAEPEDSYRKPETETLLSKYRIPIQHFEYDYIEKCTDGKELERILQVLKSGEEGYFPDLIKTAEEQLTKIKPKSRLLRKMAPVLSRNDLDKEELNEICNDLETWMIDISKRNKELEKRRLNTADCDADVRPYKEAVCEDNGRDKSEKRIKSTDYSAWDRYDADTEILKMDLAEENMKKCVVEEKPRKKTVKKSVSFNKFGTEAEAAFIAEREKEKGNEYFKAGEYEEALQCYTHSVSSKPCVNNLNNRAVAYIKLKEYKKALKDCDRVLAIDPDNLKARLRRAEGLEGLKMYKEAMRCAELVIRRDPNNAIAQELVERVRKFCEGKLKNTRMKIIEID